MQVTVKIHGDLRQKAGTDTIRMPIREDETVDALFMKLSRRCPEVVESILDPTTGELGERYNVLLNGRPLKRLRGIYTKLKNKDEITISLPET